MGQVLRTVLQRVFVSITDWLRGESEYERGLHNGENEYQRDWFLGESEYQRGLHNGENEYQRDMTKQKSRFNEALATRRISERCFSLRYSEIDRATGVVAVSGPAGRDFYHTMMDNERKGVLAVSEKMEKFLDPAGGSVTVGDCTIEFHPESFSCKTKVTMEAELDNTKLPDEIVAFTPILDVKAETWQKKNAKIRLPSLYVLKKSDKSISHVTIFHQADETQKWKDTNIVLPFSNESFIEFECRHFRRVVGGKRKKSLMSNCAIPRVAGSVYASDRREISIVYYIDTYLMLKAVEKILSQRDQEMRSKLQFISFNAEKDAKYETNIACVGPEGFSFKPPGPFFFTFGHAFVKQSEPIVQNVVISGELKRRNDDIIIECEVKKDGESVGNPQCFTHRWEAPTRQGIDSDEFHNDQPSCSSTERALAEGKRGAKHIHYHQGDKIIAQNYAKGRGTIRSSQKGTDNTISCA